jgi:anti-anti-sigma regulatory factor
MSGEMVGGCTNELSLLNEYAMQHDQVVINLAQLRRMDFVCAGMLLNTLGELAVRGKSLRLVNAGCLVAALLSAVGINQFAEIVRRRT